MGHRRRRLVDRNSRRQNLFRCAKQDQRDDRQRNPGNKGDDGQSYRTIHEGERCESDKAANRVRQDSAGGGSGQRAQDLGQELGRHHREHGFRGFRHDHLRNRQEAVRERQRRGKGGGGSAVQGRAQRLRARGEKQNGQGRNRAAAVGKGRAKLERGNNPAADNGFLGGPAPVRMPKALLQGRRGFLTFPGTVGGSASITPSVVFDAGCSAEPVLQQHPVAGRQHPRRLVGADRDPGEKCRRRIT